MAEDFRAEPDTLLLENTPFAILDGLEIILRHGLCLFQTLGDGRPNVFG
jgi:hypothetical protein